MEPDKNLCLHCGGINPNAKSIKEPGPCSRACKRALDNAAKKQAAKPKKEAAKTTKAEKPEKTDKK